MLKHYSGYALPAPVRTRFSIDWRCASCDSQNVDRDPEDVRELHWCDGGPSTEDELRIWLCGDCGCRALGHDMKTHYQSLPLTPQEEEREGRSFLEPIELDGILQPDTRPAMTPEATGSFSDQLLDALKNRQYPLPIRLEEHGVIVARDYDFCGPFALSVTFVHPEGNIVIGTNWPTRAQRLEITPDQLDGAPYMNLARLAGEITGDDWEHIDGSPWVQLDGSDVAQCFNDSGKLISASSTLRAQLVDWLIQEDEEAQWIDGLYPELHEGLVGYAILDALPKAEVTRLGLKTGDYRGGPGGSAERVAFRGDPTVLAAALQKWRLPFTLSCEDEQST